MNKIKTIAIAFMLVLFGGIYVLLVSKSDVIKDYILTDNVVVEHNGKKVFEGNINDFKVSNVKSEDIFTMYMKMPNVDIANAAIKYDNVNVAVDVYVGDELIYSIGKNTPKVGVVCHAFNKVDLEKIKKKQEIKMDIRVINASGFAFLPTVHLMNTKDSDMQYFYDMLPFIIMGGYLMVIGIVGILIAGYNMNKDIINKRLTVLSISAMVCALYFMSMYQVIPIFSDNYIMDAYCEYSSTIGVLVIINLYLAVVNPKGKKAFSIVLTCVTSLFLVVVIAMQVLRIRGFNDAMTTFLVFCVFTAINFLITYVKNSENKKILMVGAYVILSLIVLYVFLYVFLGNFKEKFLIMIPIAIMLVLTVEFMELINEVVKGLVSGAEKQALINMAYIDRSTGIGNRRGLNKYLKECTKGIYRVYLFDINGLKKVNDTYGHVAGDDLIISFAKQLKDAFTNDYIARTGGDEFVAICEDSLDSDGYIKKLEESIEIANKETKKEYTLHYSVGCEKYDPKQDTIEDVLKKADEEMYKMKKNKKR